MSREEELAGRGWTKRTTYDEPRLSEMVQMYEDLGFEVHLEPFQPMGETECAECTRQAPERFKAIYTRKRRDA